LMAEHDTDDVAPHGGIDLGTLQRYINLHYSASLDLFGAEVSTNAGSYYSAGLKGRYQEDQRADDHVLTGDMTEVERPGPGGDPEAAEVPALTALNQVLRDDYTEDCAKGLARWNRSLAPLGATLRLPHAGFHRAVGAFAGRHVSPAGHVVTEEEWSSRLGEWLPTQADRDHVASLMAAVTEPGRMASWLAPPATGVNTRPVDWEYVRL
ncbi:MAG: benzoyl-CoA 2,3-epoxidase subunit BoxB, partial [Acidimicrobiales bacterium]